MENQPVRTAIVDALMALAAEQPFEAITLPAIAERAGIGLGDLRAHYDGRLAILADHIRLIDERVLKGIDPALAKEEPRERLFDILFARLEAERPHREALRAIAHAARRDPFLALALNGVVGRSMTWMLTASGIPATGGRGALRAQALAIVWVRVLRVFLDDDDPGLARSMAALDKRLREAERAALRVERVEGFLKRSRPRRRPVDDGVEADLSERHPT